VETTSRDFQVFVKPAGAACNLDCQYCYYRKKGVLYSDGDSFRMTESLLEDYIVQHFQAAPGPEVNFSWHGGEPTILGLGFFQQAVTLQQKHRPAGWRARNGIQTNGVLLDEEWCRFLARENFSIGLSLDGPAELHDPYRVTHNGNPTHAQAMRAYRLLRQMNISTDILCVVHNLNVRSPLAVYRFFRSLGCRYVGFLPVVEPSRDTASGVSAHTVPADEYGTFLCRIFDEWIERDAGRIMIQAFEEAARPALGLEHSMCMFRETCGQIPVLEHNGDFYSCDHFVDRGHRLGNIRETALSALLDGEAQQSFGSAKRDTLPRYCRECDVLAQCNGGCPKYRFIRTPNGEPGLNFLCPGLKRFFRHSREPLAKLVSGQRQPTPKSRTVAAGRNNPCPCGSGKKFKKCCGA